MNPEAEKQKNSDYKEDAVFKQSVQLTIKKPLVMSHKGFYIIWKFLKNRLYLRSFMQELYEIFPFASKGYRRESILIFFHFYFSVIQNFPVKILF